MPLEWSAAIDIGPTIPEVEFDSRTLSGSDGSTITSWGDISGHSGRTMALTLDPTTLETNELNGNQVTRWNGGAGDWIGNPQSNVYTVIAVLKCTSFSSPRTVMSAITGGVEGTIPLVWLSTAGKIEIVQTDVTVLATSSTALSAGTFYTICAQYDGNTGAYAFYLNGALDGSGTTTPIVFAHFSRIGRRNGNQNPFPGDIFYMGLWNSFLGSGELSSRFDDLRTVGAHY
jgi:concanavalin A-like lectin/glucanase superfamily protein